MNFSNFIFCYLCARFLQQLLFSEFLYFHPYILIIIVSKQDIVNQSSKVHDLRHQYDEHFQVIESGILETDELSKTERARQEVSLQLYNIIFLTLACS